MNDITAELKDDISKAQKVIVGIGLKMASSPDSDKEEIAALKEGYGRLRKILEGKDYYILTLCMDDLIYDAFESDRIVAPCGGYRRLQCEDHLLDYEISKGFKSGDPCPLCAKLLGYNNIDNPNYLEEGYLPDFNQYKRWLMGTVNRPLCMLELGCDMRFPGIIRMAFDKICTYNEKCRFYRVNEQLYQHIAENGERGISVKMKALDFLLDC